MFCSTKESTGHTDKDGRSRDAHIMSPNSCDLRLNYLNLFKGVTTDISVVGSDWISV